MVHNLPEPEQPSAQERTSADTKTVEGLIKDKLSVTDVKVLRLEEKARRSLLVVFDDEKTKWTCLRCASRLKDDAVFQKVYISPDLTPQERKENRELLMELKRRREEGEKDIMIRRDRIVKKINTDN